MILLIIFLFAVYLIYRWGTNTFDYFRAKGIPYLKPRFLIGTSENFFTKKWSLNDYCLEYYHALEGEK